uniref:Uncharacterized protein n=1 Tax=Oryza sativa subsp. japonica TaxID=39947 RepID=Q6ZDP8_ORYSJ|nr:hypothetical protein [Oryza sativa Japonica Group]BAD30385.1 hypothetical protein [Oryza sativa Japonica Group]
MAGAAAATAARGLTGLGLYGRWQSKTRVAAGSGGLGGPFIGVGRRRRRPTATSDEKERLGFGGERRIRFEIESTDFQTEISRRFHKRKGRGDRGDYFPSNDFTGNGKDRPDWKAAAARVSAGSGARRKTGLTGGTHLSAAPRERRKRRRAGPTGPGREKALGRLSAQSQKRLSKTFFNLNYS